MPVAARPLCALVAAAAAAACTPGPAPSAEPDAGPAGSAADAGAADAGTAVLADFRKCETTADCPEGTDCTAIPLLINERQCLPRCATTGDCPVDTVCQPSGTASGALANHCWYSTCGETLGNGKTGGACRLGAEAGVVAAQQRDGWCRPLMDAQVGLCDEVGSVAVGGACDLPRRRGGALCDGNGACEAGTCAARCDPRKVLAGEPTGCPAGSGCLDLSTALTGLPQTVGICRTGALACSVFASGACPAGRTCVPTNPLRATGTCRAPGPDGEGAACEGGGVADPLRSTCGAGLYCAAATCRRLCDRAASGQCGSGECRPLVWDAAGPGAADDVQAAGWGVCVER